MSEHPLSGELRNVRVGMVSNRRTLIEEFGAEDFDQERYTADMLAVKRAMTELDRLHAENARLRAEKKEEAVKKELKAVEGTWELVARLSEGASDPPRPGDRPTLTIRNGRYQHAAAGRVTGEGVFHLDPTVTPKAVDVVHDSGTYKGKPVPGIYELSGDQLRICFASAPGKARPAKIEVSW